jgi:hypothetical protein
MASLAELQAELVEVNEAIRDQMGVGAEYGLGDRRFKGIAYGDLQKRKRELNNAIKVASGGLPGPVTMLTDVSRAD